MDERFCWISHLRLHPYLQLTRGVGFTTMTPTPGAHATVGELRRGVKPGHLMSAIALTSIRTENDLRFVLLQRSLDALVAPGLWVFPAGRCDVGEHPASCAHRELTEEVGVQGDEQFWAQAARRPGGPRVTLVTEHGVPDEFQAHWACQDNTVEFCYPIQVAVPTFDAGRLYDKEGMGRNVVLLTPDELQAMALAGKLSPAATSVWRYAQQASLLTAF